MDKYASPVFLDAVDALKKNNGDCVNGLGSVSISVEREKLRLDDGFLKYESLNIIVLKLPERPLKKPYEENRQLHFHFYDDVKGGRREENAERELFPDHKWAEKKLIEAERGRKEKAMVVAYGKIHSILSGKYNILESRVKGCEIEYVISQKGEGKARHLLQIGYGYTDRHGIPVEFHAKGKNIDRLLGPWKDTRTK
ncbi:MAG: hypothetical protein AABX35_04730 [Nanoarchaeota archaeon]